MNKEIAKIMEKLAYLNELCGNIFDKTLIYEEEIEFAKKLPLSALFREYKIKLVGELEKIEEQSRSSQTTDENMDLCFFIAAEHALLGDSVEKMKFYTERLDWEKWNPNKTKNPEIALAWRDLYLRAIALRP